MALVESLSVLPTSALPSLTRSSLPDTNYLPEYFPPPSFPSDPSDEQEKPQRPGPAPIEIDPTPPSAGAADANLELGSVKDETTTAISFDESTAKPIGLPKEVASVKLDSFKEEESVETVVGDLPPPEKK